MIRYILIFLIQAIRPLLGPSGCCRYAFSCYDYGIMQLQEESLLPALVAISKRLFSCNPFISFQESDVHNKTLLDLREQDDRERA